MTETLTENAAIRLTPGAVQHVRALMRKQGSPEELDLRLGVMGGGCSGLSYVVRLEATARETDHRFEFDGVRVLVDPKSMRVLAGTVLDYDITNLLEGGFKFNNPNAKRGCGCGTSFQV